MSKITSLQAREILNSRGLPSVEVLLALGEVTAVASVPSGASTGVHEALELVDGDKSRYQGKGVLKAVLNIQNEIAKSVIGKEFTQKELDNFLIALDGTKNKSRLGANAILAVSLAFARASAKEKNLELFQYISELGGNTDFKLPEPSLNVINGGQHADSGLDIQEFMIVPVGFENFHKKIEAGQKTISCLKKLLQGKGLTVSIGDEGGFAPKLASNEEAFDFLTEAISAAGYTTDQVKIAMDSAASSFYENGAYEIKIAGENKKLTSAEMIEWYGQLAEKYPLISIEDGLAEDDWDGFAQLTEKFGKQMMIVGDDLLVTNVERIKMAIERKAVNSVLIKLNQIGTLSETIDAILLTKGQNWIPFVSHRSGETEDTFIADLVVGLSCQFIKSGSLARGERVAKYNRLMQIEDILLRK